MMMTAVKSCVSKQAYVPPLADPATGVTACFFAQASGAKLKGVWGRTGKQDFASKIRGLLSLPVSVVSSPPAVRLCAPLGPA